MENFSATDTRQRIQADLDRADTSGVTSPRQSAVDSGRLQLVGAGFLASGTIFILAGIAFQNAWLSASGLGWASIGVLWVIVGFERAEFPLMHPLLLWSLSLLFGSALRPLYLLTQPEELRSGFLSGLPPETILSGARLNGIFLLASVVGYLAIPKIAARRSTVRGLERSRSLDGVNARSLATVVVVAVSAVAFLFYLQRLGLSFSDLTNRLAAKRRVEIAGQSSSLGALTWISSVSLFAALVLLFVRSHQPKTERIGGALIAALVLLGLAIPIVNGSRDGILQPLLLIVLIVSQFGSRLRLRGVFSLLVVSVVLITTFAAFRAAASNDIAASSILAPTEVAETLLATHNWAGAEKTAVIEARVPELLDFQGGSTYVSALVAPIPRTIWSGKPTVRIGPLIGDELFFLDRDGRTGLPPGTPAELFINFGYLGVPIGGLFFGALLRAAYTQFVRTDKTDVKRVVLAVAILNLGLKLPGGDFAGVFTEVLMSTLIIFGLARLYVWLTS